MANVLYIIWWEGTKRGGIIENQVYRQLEHTRRAGDHSIMLLSGGPFWAGRLIRTLKKIFPRVLSGRGEGWLDPESLSARLAQAGIRVRFRNTAWHPANLYLAWWQLLLAPLPQLFFLHRLCCREHIDIVHCRSYFPAWLALLSRSFFGGDYRIIFDTRGLLPDEGVSMGFLREGGWSHSLWKIVERRLFRGVDKVVNISETFTEDLRAHGGPENMETIYASVDITAFTNPARHLPSVQMLANELKQHKTLVYLGAISSVGWHSIAYLARLYRCFKMQFPASRLLLVTASDHDEIRRDLIAEGVFDDEIIIRVAHSPAEVAAMLELATYAALPFRNIRGDHDRRIAHTMIASKLAEYLAAGLPIICNRNIGGASRIITDKNVGCLVDLDGNGDEIPGPLLHAEAGSDLRSHCRGVAKLFGMDRIGKKYAHLYKKMA